MSSGFSHFDDGGNAVMVDVSDKPETRREAVAERWCGARPKPSA